MDLEMIKPMPIPVFSVVSICSNRWGEMTRIDSRAVIFNGTANLIKCCTISTNNDLSNIDIVRGKLVPVLMDWELPLLTMNIAYQNRVRLPAKIRMFSDFLVDYIRENSDTGIWMDAKD
jgi:hypothetical protein